MELLNFYEKNKRIGIISAIIITYLFITIAIGWEINTATNSLFQEVARYIFIFFAIISSFLIFFLKKGSKIRWFLFSIMSIVFFIGFMYNLFLERGHIGLNESDIQYGLPFCHIAIVNEILSIPILKTFVFPGQLSGHYAAIYAMVIIWFWATILIGKGWCSWGCFYGGWDTLFSGILKKPLIKISEKTSKKLRFLPYAMLISMAILSFILFVPFFCDYLCPFKTITEFVQVTNIYSWTIFLITVVGFFSFCILLPVFFGRRIWCTYLCPFGAFQGLVGKVFSVFKIKIDKEKCINCKKCIAVCKTSGITEESLSKYKTTFNCSLCTGCIDECPKKAIEISSFGSTKSPASLLRKILDKIFLNKEKVSSGILFKIKEFFIGLIEGLLSPQTFLYFSGLTVFFTFFTGFYFNTVSFLEAVIKGVFHG